MPNYLYLCSKCEKQFNVFNLIRDYKPQETCPDCQTVAARDFANDLPTRLTIDIPKTLGSLADRNSASYSDDQRAEMLREQNKYKDQDIDMPNDKMKHVKRNKNAVKFK